MYDPRIATAVLGSARAVRRAPDVTTVRFVAWLARRLGLASLGAWRRT